jgi:archaellum component FlaC
MGWYDYMWNASQSGQIRELQEKVEELEKKTEVLKEWVDFLHNEIKVLKDAQTK